MRECEGGREGGIAVAKPPRRIVRKLAGEIWAGAEAEKSGFDAVSNTQ
jgi:hypothetical protein